MRRLGFAFLLSALVCLAGGPAARALESEQDFIFVSPPVPAPAVPFEGPGGEGLTLEDFRGRVVLLNFWATWCAPCVLEMPLLDTLQTRLGPEGLVVLALSEDRRGRAAVEPFYQRTGIEALEIYLDPGNRLAKALELSALPTTYLIDRSGRIVGALEGPAVWDGPGAEDLIRPYLEEAAPGGVTTRTNARTERTTGAPVPVLLQRVGTGLSPE